ncbi:MULTISPECIES: dicarboxylate/amino acid:cation symporter [Clostridia]|uniref:Dicarboxylate/amino acid:cation symporter n=1 Tax=Faecalicatena fissicatena TaxID=290055 RepID=A0ABS2E7C0_9FIRM|nr:MULTISPECIES: dicarboxylate/amino acid:cation symporter [Clostridia]MBM6737504.1 dicarboxylate/amino acid:cation symporter [Faecalicatena fissicatena]HIX98261.1 dicarboxylate/amino acid:cation symporter [Candidatus Dorea intestinigallinarum]
MKKLLKTPLWAQILAGIIIGIIIGIVSPKAADFISPLGDIFLNLLKMLIVPLVLFSITNGICSMKDAKQLRSVGGRIVIYYTLSTVAASIFGVIGGMITQPGKNVSDFVLSGEAAEASDFDMVENIISWFPDNIVKAMVDANMIQIIVFCLFLGVALLALGDQASTFVKIIKEGNDIMLKITSYVIGFSPIGILSLMASMVSTLSGAMVKEVIVFILTIDITILVFMVVFYPTVLKLLARVNVGKFFKKISTSMLVAFTTTSSAATLPVSIKIAEERLGCSEKVYGFTLPLGNTCNMDGAAIQYSVIAIFACNLFGLDITPERIFQFIFLSLILSIGAAGVKGSGIVMSTIIIQTIIGDAGLTLIPILAAVWPILDPFATMANNVGDLTGTTLVSKSLKMLDEDVYNS